MPDTIFLVDYNPHWPAMFTAEQRSLEQACPALFLQIHHVGSTSVAGLAAKPVIDILAVVADQSLLDVAQEDAAIPGQNRAIDPRGNASHVAMVRAVSGLGFTYRGENGLPGRIYFQRRQDGVGAHLHIVAKGSWFVAEQLAFRDWLRANPSDAQAYQELKRNLASQFAHDRVAYTMEKSDFISQVLRKAGVAPRPA
ncbi:MAG: GrpB family protein [Planctomycetes bacterium]|nr:GrpB family protein [Planctomycetota bacterium]